MRSLVCFPKTPNYGANADGSPRIPAMPTILFQHDTGAAILMILRMSFGDNDALQAM